MKDMVTTMIPIVKIFFTSAEKIAKETKFVQRTSKMTGNLFLQTFVFGLLENAMASLNDFVEFCDDHFGITMSTQGLDERDSSGNAALYEADVHAGFEGVSSNGPSAFRDTGSIFCGEYH